MLTTVVSSTTITCATPMTARISQRREYARSVGSIDRSLVRNRWELSCRPDRTNFDQMKTERLDLPEHAEQRGLILKQPCQHSLTALQFRHQRGKGREGGWSEPALDSDGVQTGRFTHTPILPRRVVSLRRRNLVNARPGGRGLRLRSVRASAREQSEFARAFHGGGAITHGELVVDVAHVRVHRVHGHE